MSSAFALKFISGKYQGGEFPLTQGRAVVIGRSADLDMVLVEDMVSRKHAKVGFVGEQILIADLGSTNGTFVNGEKIRQAWLNEGDRVLIGTSILKVVSTAGRAQMTAAVAKEQLEARGRQSPRSSTMSGTLEEVPIPDLLQLFSTSKRTGVLHVRTEHTYGKIYLRDGDLYYASIDDDHELGPMKALCRMVGWESGSFEFGPPEPDPELMIELQQSTESLLMEAMRQLDELRRIAADLPGLQQRLQVPLPLQPMLSELKPPVLDVFQWVMNEGQVQRIFDRAPGTDAETAEALLALLEGGYVVRS